MSWCIRVDYVQIPLNILTEMKTRQCMGMRSYFVSQLEIHRNLIRNLLSFEGPNFAGKFILPDLRVFVNFLRIPEFPLFFKVLYKIHSKQTRFPNSDCCLFKEEYPA